MNRLFVIVKTDSTLTGTLLELNAREKVEKTVQQIIQYVGDLHAPGSTAPAPDYQLVCLGNPKRLVPHDQTLGAAGIKNGNVLVLTQTPDAILTGGLFDFEPLSVALQDVSVQDLRALLRVPVKPTFTGQTPVSEQHVAQPPMKALPATDTPQPPPKPGVAFEFEHVDLGLPETGSNDDHPGKSAGPTAGKRKKASSS